MLRPTIVFDAALLILSFSGIYIRQNAKVYTRQSIKDRYVYTAIQGSVLTLVLSASLFSLGA